MNIVRNKASPIKTWFGGVVCVPNAARIKCRTIRILVNDVTIIRIDGTKDITVNNNNICSVDVNEPVPSPVNSKLNPPKLPDKSAKVSLVSVSPLSMFIPSCDAKIE